MFKRILEFLKDFFLEEIPEMSDEEKYFYCQRLKHTNWCNLKCHKCEYWVKEKEL